MAFEDYKKVVRIKDRDSISGELTYELVYVSESTYDTETPKEIYNSIPKANRLPVAGDKMYFLNDVVIPRFKIKSFCEETGGKVVKYLNSGNYVIIGKKTIGKFFENSYNIEADKDECLDFINLLINNMQSLTPVWMTDLRQLIIDCDENVLFSNNYTFSKWFKDHTDINLGYSQSLTEISYDNYSKLTEIMSLTCDIVEEDVILKDLNKNTVMDKEIFENIQKLFESVDNENTKLAMELMSNCDFDKSAPYLLLLLKMFHKKIYDSSTKNHVNFKGMLNYFNLHVNDTYRMEYNDILRIIMQKKVLYKSSMQILKDMVLEDMNPSLHYKVIDIAFIDENDEVVEIIDDTIVAEVPEVPEIDAIIYSELSEVAVSIKDPTLYIKIMNVRALVDSPEALLPIIKYLDETYEYELATLLTQSYLSLPHEI